MSRNHERTVQSFRSIEESVTVEASVKQSRGTAASCNQYPHKHTHTHTHTRQCMYLYTYIGSDDYTTFVVFLSCPVIPRQNFVLFYPKSSAGCNQGELRLVGHGRMEHLSSRLKQPIPIPPIPLERFQWNSWMLLSPFASLSWLTR